MQDKLFEIKDLYKSFGKKEVLKGLSFDVIKGEILGIVGKSGAGKSTLMNILSNIIYSYKGQIIFNNEEKKPLNRIIGFSFQPYSFYEELTLKDNLLYFGKLYGLSKKNILSNVQTLFSITDLSIQELNNSAKDLSGGMKKRFDIVCSLLHEPEILILDEPTAGLDPLRRKHTINILKKINQTGVTIIISSHIMKDIDDICDRVMIIGDGKKIIIDKPENIKSELLEHEKITIRSTPGNYDNIIKQLSSFRILHASKEDDKLIVYTPEAEIIIHFLLHLIEADNEILEQIVISEPNLFEVFSVLDNKKEGLILKENIEALNSFIFTLIGKKYPEAKIKEIMMNHKWPKEIVDILVGKVIINRVENIK